MWSLLCLIVYIFQLSVPVGNLMNNIFIYLNSIIKFILICFYLSKIFGRINSIAFLFVVPFLCGFSIFLEIPERRDITVTTFVSMFLECYYKLLCNNKIIMRSKKFETLLFMLVNALLMYSLRIRQDLSNRKETLWFFTPTSTTHEDTSENILQNNNEKYSQKFSYTKNIIRNSLKYSSIGLALSVIKFLVYKVMSPLNNQESFFRWKSLRLPFFMGSYVSTFEALSYYLYKKEGNYHYYQTFWSGLFSGISYFLNPNLQVLFTAITILLKIQGDQLKKKYKMANFPYSEFSFIISNMFLLQRMILDHKRVPTFFYNMFMFGTMKKASHMIDGIQKHYLT
ncbi:unnamed protein product [Nezara viridula]|uniref:Uncharacterized protein n=1 Tax=Nezara viridula TaxID=85310 RepID=A0A9P0MVP6_NEZVI|nr:unnamed protein product [Nezara viridula]